GRFLSRDPIDISDDVNLYTYVGNNPVMFVDRMGLEKVLIITGIPTDDSQISGFNLTAGYQIEKAFERGVKWENIVLINGVMTPEQFNDTIKQYLGDIKEIVYIAHGTQGSTGDITADNISKLNPIKVDSNDNPLITLISCNTGKGENSIAQQISNHLDVNVNAPNDFVTVYEESDLDLKDFNRKDFFNALLKHDLGEPTLKIGNWLKFSSK
ncbi:hypothetical protein EOM39_07720, partial [Candidatus Gracilibacteria bacterium]|nr:hypothetical protein [Candidatus Gracilibacteria bacterium]